MIDYRKKLNRYLEANNRKLTQERVELLDALLKLSRCKCGKRKGHFTVKDVYNQIKAMNSPLSMATVYRSLPLFHDAGIIVEIAQRGGKMIYELATDECHSHLFCCVCGKVIEFKNDDFERLQRVICQENGFSMTDNFSCIKGICRNCQDSQKDN